MSEKLLVSICIPVYEMTDGVMMLETLLDSIETQVYSNIQVVVSDHSKDKRFKEVCERRHSLNMKYCSFDKKYGNGPANTNNAIRNADGELIKPIFQDDFLAEPTAIEKMVNVLNDSGKNWIACGCLHTDTNGKSRTNRHFPLWGGMDENKSISSYTSRSQKIGSPSVIMYKRNELEFDETLVMLMDYSFYYKLGKYYGDPVFVEESLMIIRVWPGSISSRLGYGMVGREKKYLMENY